MNRITETNEAYHDRREISASDLKLMDKSWRIYQAKVEGRLKREPTPSMELGTAVHCAVLEPERYAVEYVTDPGLDRRTKAFKEWKATVHPSMTIIKPETAEVVKECSESLRSHPLIRSALESSDFVERSHVWQCGETDAPCKFRPDLIVPSSRIILDVKTTQSVDDWGKTVANFGYHIQAAHYVAGAVAHYGGEPTDWVFLFAAVETSAPYRCRSICLDAESLDFGHYRREQLLHEYVRRLNEDDWSDPDEHELVTVSLPNWFTRRA